MIFKLTIADKKNGKIVRTRVEASCEEHAVEDVTTWYAEVLHVSPTHSAAIERKARHREIRRNAGTFFN